MIKKITRRRFVQLLVAGFTTLVTGGLLTKKISIAARDAGPNGRKRKGAKGLRDLIDVSGNDPYKMTRDAIREMGGMGRFVKKNETVVVKPNMAWDRGVEYAANTNPLVVAALVELCYEAGARRVNVFDITCNTAGRCYENSGIKKAAEGKGARVYFTDDWNFIKARFGYKSPMEGWPIYRDALKCDTFINCPILKDHGLTGLTLSMKNLMGVCGGERGRMHQGIGKKLVDLTDLISPDLTVIDAYRVLTANGPQGGSLSDVKEYKRLIVATDSTLADSYAAAMVSKDPLSVSYIKEAHDRGFGSTDINKAAISKITA